MRTELESGAVVEAIIDKDGDVRVYALLSLKDDPTKEYLVDVTMIIGNVEFDNLSDEVKEYYDKQYELEEMEGQYADGFITINDLDDWKNKNGF